MKLHKFSKSILAVFFILFITASLLSVTSNILIVNGKDCNIINSFIGSVLKIQKEKDDFKYTASIQNFNIDLYGSVQRFIGNDYVFEPKPRSPVVRLNDDYITFFQEKISNKELKHVDENLRSFNTFLEDRDIDFIYVMAPYKICKEDVNLSLEYKDFSNENADIFLKKLQDAGIDYIDLRKSLHDENINHHDLFYNTDHHWTTKAGIWATKKINEKLENDYGFKPDNYYTNLNNYRIENEKKAFLGTHGRRVGAYYAGLDDVDIYLPKNTSKNFSYEILDTDAEPVTKSGSFEECFVYKDRIYDRRYKSDANSIYSGGNYALSKMINNDIKDKKILLIRDSFGCSVAPFLAASACHELNIIDPRLYKESIQSYIDSFNPDVVIILYYPGAFSEQEYESFFNLNR